MERGNTRKQRRPTQAARLINDLKENPQNWERTGHTVKPASGKGYRSGNPLPHDQKMSAEDKVEGAELNRLEHNILSLLTNFIVPLYAIYADMMRDLDKVSLDTILGALVRLVEMDFAECYMVTDSGPKRIERLTLYDLQQRCSGLSEKELAEYPVYVPEYEFKITEKGITEETRDIYDAYYPREE
jgi:hypothetical protein